MLQHVVVVIIVAAAAAYAAWLLTPARARLVLLARLDATLERRETAAGGGRPPGLLRSRLVGPLLRRAAPTGGCASCGPDSPAAAKPGRDARKS
jgi:hypothetical protein